jgi:uncharacterized membrane protein
MSPTDENRPNPAASPTLTEHIEHNIESVVALQRKEWDTIGGAQRRVERVSRFLGRPLYLIALLAAIALWVGVNVFATGAVRWDPPPFELLDGLMTLISLVTTTIVLIAQHRQAKLEKQHTHLGLQVALITEQKVTKVINLLEELRRDMPMVKDRHDAHVSIPSIVVSDSRPSWTVPRGRRRPPPILLRCPRWVDGTTIF